MIQHHYVIPIPCIFHFDYKFHFYHFYYISDPQAEPRNVINLDRYTPLIIKNLGEALFWSPLSNRA